MKPGHTYHLRVKVNGEDIPTERLCPEDPELCSFTVRPCQYYSVSKLIRPYQINF